MNEGISIELTNRDEIMNLLQKVPERYQTKAVIKMFRYATKPLVTGIKSMAVVSRKPHMSKYGLVRPGTMKRSIAMIEMLRAKLATAIVGPRVKGSYGGVKSGFYAVWVEGTYKQTKYKEYKTHPFMRPAWDANKSEVQRRFNEDVMSAFEKEIARLTKKGKI